MRPFTYERAHDTAAAVAAVADAIGGAAPRPSDRRHAGRRGSSRPRGSAPRRPRHGRLGNDRIEATQEGGLQIGAGVSNSGAHAEQAAFARAAEAELAQARALRDNAYKAALARNLIVATLGGLCSWCSARRQRRRPWVHLTSGSSTPEGHRRARYAYEHPREDAAYAWIIGATIAKGLIRSIDAAAAALPAPGVIGVLTHENARPCTR